jgi:hypothetical protein
LVNTSFRSFSSCIFCANCSVFVFKELRNCDGPGDGGRFALLAPPIPNPLFRLTSACPLDGLRFPAEKGLARGFFNIDMASSLLVPTSTFNGVVVLQWESCGTAAGAGVSASGSKFWMCLLYDASPDSWMCRSMDCHSKFRATPSIQVSDIPLLLLKVR